MPIPSRTLSIAHEALAVIAGIGLVLVLAVIWDDSGTINIGALRRPAQAVMMGAVAYLFTSSWLEFRLSDALRAGDRIRQSSWLQLAGLHALVLVTATSAMMQADQSRVYLAGMHQPLAALGTVTCLGLALAIGTWLSARQGPTTSPPAPAGLSRLEAWVPWAVHLAAGLFVTAALWYLESLPLPH